MATTDSLGTWEYLGLIYPEPNQWTFFPANVVNSETLRLSFSTDWSKRNYYYASYGLVRFVYQTPELTTSQTFKVWPTQEKQIRKFDIANEFGAGIDVVCAVQIKRVLRSRYDLPDLDPSWAIEAEYLVSF